MNGLAQHARLLKASLRLSSLEVEQALALAWSRYTNLPNADLRVGRAKYEAEVAAINALEEPMDLRSCPFCGGTDARTIHIRDGSKVICICGASSKHEFHGPLDKPNAETRAIAAWNTRAPDPKAQRLADALEALINSFEKHRPKELWDEARAALAEWKP